MILNNWQIVIMRPKHQAHALEAYVKGQGGHAVLLPMIEIVACPLLQEEYQADIIIVCSQNSLTFAPNHLLEFLRTTQASMMTMKEATSETLLARTDLQNVYNKKVLLLAGKGGRDLIQKTLISRGAIVTKIEIYEQRPIRHDFQQISHQQTCFIASSLNILNNFFNQTPEALKPWVCSQFLIVVSERIEQEAIKYGFKHIINAKGADLLSLTKALQNVVKVCNTETRSHFI